MLLELISKGGLLIWPILACSFVGLGIFAERFLTYHRATINVPDFLHGLRNLIQRKNYAEALHECAGTPGPVARVIHAAVRRHHAPRADLKAITQEAGQLEVPGLERYLNALLAIAYVTPLLGLLGTMLGMIDAFASIAATGYATPSEMGRGIYQALYSSAAGLAVAVPTYVLYTYLSASARSIIHDMERAGTEVVNIICDSRERRDSDIIAFGENRPAEDDAPEAGRKRKAKS